MRLGASVSAHVMHLQQRKLVVWSWELQDRPISNNIPRERQDAARAFSARLMPVLNGFVSQGLSRRAMVMRLNGLGITAPRGGAWSLGQVQRVIQTG